MWEIYFGNIKKCNEWFKEPFFPLEHSNVEQFLGIFFSYTLSPAGGTGKPIEIVKVQ